MAEPLNNTDGCIRLVAAVINPKNYAHRGGQKRREKELLPPLGPEWVSIAAGLLDIDLEVITKQLEGKHAED